MLNGKVILAIIVFALFTLACVSAQDNVTDDVVSLGDECDVIQSNESHIDESIHSGYWVLSADRNKLDLDDLSEHGVTDVFLNFRSYEVYGKDDLESWISNASQKGIHTHIWTQIFWTSKTGWVLPVVNGSENTEFFTHKIDELNMYASLKGLSGIHMDYLRYSGSQTSSDEGKRAITDFVIKSTSSIRQINPNLTISVALMPNLNSLQNVYGVDYPTISRYFDVIIPMVYSGNFKKDREWITSTTRDFILNSNGAKIWTGLQSYVNDQDLTHLSISQMNADIKAALNAGASGTVIFRYGVSENINFNDAINLAVTIDAKPASYVAVFGGKYQITLKDSYGNPIPSEKVIFTMNGKGIGSACTDSNGIAKIKLTSKILKSAKIGTNKLVIKLPDGKTKTVKITVKKDKPKLKISKKKRKIRITLKNSRNDPIKKAKITLKHKGKVYKLKTNSKGKATFKAKGKGKVSVKFKSKYYKSVSVKI